MNKFPNSVLLNPDKCNGCINCLKRCPTEAVRIRRGKSVISHMRCIDCGECIRVCPARAKTPVRDPLAVTDGYRYKVALPHPALYAQFNNLEDKAAVLGALLAYGFDDIYEVGAAAEKVSEATRRLIAEGKVNLPLISSACPSVIRLIRVRFPNLIPYISPLNAPEDVAAKTALRRAERKTALPREEIGVFLIAPCPAKTTSVRAPVGLEKSDIDGVIAISDIFPKLPSLMKNLDLENLFPDGETLNTAGRIGVSWGGTGGEAGGVLSDRCLSADGVENVMKVLSHLEDERFQNLEFIELSACSGGCLGGVLTIENPYIARVKLNALRKYLPVSGARLDGSEKKSLFWQGEIEYVPAYGLSDDIGESISLMEKLERILEKLPGLDCGCCGAPTCRAFAEDVIRGHKGGCIHKRAAGDFYSEI
ncbi:MAG: 4Fe-4S dicluster domain-containing protein [Oscillospiraceae bacterium]|jgi:iron only hydrogenase large subunit-like protein|nr:4Fe-4S dicluster domain-containing protein [Oscillospiraceae bacterium]